MRELEQMERELLEREQVICKELGGKLGLFLQWAEDSRIVLDCCNRLRWTEDGRPIEEIGKLAFSGPWYGYRNPWGLPDLTGERWAVYLKCERCGYMFSWLKVERAIDDIEGRPRTRRSSSRVLSWWNARGRPWRRA